MSRLPKSHVTPATLDRMREEAAERQGGHVDARDRVRIRRAITAAIDARELAVHEAYALVGRPVSHLGDATPTTDLQAVLDAIEALPRPGAVRFALGWSAEGVGVLLGGPTPPRCA